LGNALIQAGALCAAGSLAEMRSLIRQAVRLTSYQPTQPDGAWDRADQIVLASRGDRS
jgi:hypothetical protein